MSKAQRARLIKLQEMQVRKILKNHVVVHVAYMTDGTLVYTKDGQPVDISKEAAHALARFQIKWGVTCYALMRDNNGREYLKSFVATAPQPCKHEKIREQIADLLYDFVGSECNPNHFLSVAWLATDSVNDIPDETADKIFTSMGAWGEFLAPHEEINQGAKACAI